MYPHADRLNAIHEELRAAVLGVHAAHGIEYREVRDIAWAVDAKLYDMARGILEHKLEAERAASDVEAA